ncbi:MAG TPA: HAMP domain-containing sensor histidine kinase [bacterium]|nr:HAMP domain-containing sensor histidine kinase [bacterium]
MTEPAQSEKMAAFELLIGGIAHDINNPLAGVLAFTQIAMQGAAAGSQAHQDLKEIESSALRCKKILEDLVELARPKVAAEFRELDLAALIRQVLPEIFSRHPGLENRLECRLAALPPVKLSPRHFEMAFGHLLANAFQALGPEGKIRVEIRENGGSIELEVRDQGQGIPEQHLHQIFDPYFTTKRQRGHHGLGLALCYNVVREHGGRIEVSSKVGEGSVFKVSLPKGGQT